MNNMKKILLAAMSAAVLTVFAGCGEDIPTEPTVTNAPETTAAVAVDGTDTTNAGQPAADGLCFSYTSASGVEFVIDAECDPLIEKQGEPTKTFEAPSCAFDGKSYTYTYDGFTVETYPDNNVNRVYAVTLTDNTTQTAEGVKVGASAEDVKAACGEPDVDSDAFLVYNGDGVDLQFFMEDGSVSQIVYTYHVG